MKISSDKLLDVYKILLGLLLATGLVMSVIGVGGMI